jgi:putative tricarboxylic transport membrane protein
LIKNAGVWAGLALLAYSAVLFQQSLLLDYYNPYGPGPGFLPRWLSALLLIVAVLYIRDSIKAEVIKLVELLPLGDARLDILLMLTGLCLFALLVEDIGFVLAGTQLVFLMTVRKFKWYYALPTAAAIAVLLLIAFQTLLGVSLPVNDFGW